eukprot:EG_transcript_48994
MHCAIFFALVIATLWLRAITCDADLAERVRRSVGHLSNSTGCPDAVWKRAFLRTAAARRRPGPVVALDVGCNKGYDALSLFNLITQDVTVDGEMWSRATGFDCGVCSQCRSPAAQR